MKVSTAILFITIATLVSSSFSIKKGHLAELAYSASVVAKPMENGKPKETDTVVTEVDDGKGKPVKETKVLTGTPGHMKVKSDTIQEKGKDGKWQNDDAQQAAADRNRLADAAKGDKDAK